MLGRNKKTKSIRKKLLLVVLLPIVILGILIIVFGMTLLYRSYAQSIQDELESATDIMIDCLNLTVKGDYYYKNNSLYKGDLNITDFSLLHRAKERSGIDTTIFWQDTRVITTVENELGVSAVGTKASPEVAKEVLKLGRNYYSSNLDINGVAYIGYYTPLENSDNSIVGMVFAGKTREAVFQKITGILIWFLLFSIIAVLIAVSLSQSFSNRMVRDINIINNFLKTISEGNLTATLDETVPKRGDELGSIGTYAARMRSELQTMIERDPLTALFNRRSINNKLKALEKKGIGFCVVMCDIDWFKKINDTYGHDAGDYILVSISKIIRDNVKKNGFAGRWGGEEFLLIYCLGLEETIKKVEEIKKEITEYDFKYESTHIKITMTFGIEGDGLKEPYEARIMKADDRLYIGKNTGRNKVVYKDEEKAG